MSSSTSKPSSKPSKSPSRPQPSPQSKPPLSISSHLAMLDLKSRILSSLSKISDRDTHQIAVEDLENIIRSLPADGFPMLLSSLLHDPVPSPGDPSGARSSPIVARRESIRLLSLLCAAYPDSAAAHLPKIIALIVRRLKDPVSDSSVRDACGEAAASLAAIYLRSNAEEAGGGRVSVSPVAGLFVKPLLEVMGEQSKTVQAGAAMCLGKVVEGGGGGGGAAAFQRLCPRICKMIGAQSFLAKGSLLSVISKLAQTGAISSQSMPTVLQSVRECLENNDWATRKAAADTLSVLASQSSILIVDGASQTISSLEACRFDKVKPVRDSIMDALQLWKKISGQGDDGTPESLKFVESEYAEEKLGNKYLNHKSKRPESVRDSSADSSSTGSGSLSNVKCTNPPETATDLLKIKAPSLKDKELNPDFFQKLESRNSVDVPVEVVLPRGCLQSSHSKDGDKNASTDGDPGGASDPDVVVGYELNENLEHPYRLYNTTERKLGANSRQQNSDFLVRHKWAEQLSSRDSKPRAFHTDNRVEFSPGDSAGRASVSQTDGLVESTFMNNKGNWLGIQRQLSHLERQQGHLMNMLQNFMGGSHDSLITLEDRVHGLERVVEEMARDLSISSGRRGGNMMMGFEGSPGRSFSKYNGLQDYTAPKFIRCGESRISYPERYLSSEGMVSISRGRESRRSDSEGWDSYVHNSLRNGIWTGRRGIVASSVDGRLGRNEHGGDQVSSRRACDKGEGPFRLGEGPSARSVWQASKDEATLEAIRVAGDDNGTSRVETRRPIPEVDAEVMADDNSGQEVDPVWASWTRAMDLLHIGDVDSAYAEVLSTGDDVLLVKLMERSGPAINELSGELASELLNAVGQFLLEQGLTDIALAWIQQLMNLIMENGPNFLIIPFDVKREILLNLHEASSSMELQEEDINGVSPYRLFLQLASAWGIEIQHLIK